MSKKELHNTKRESKANKAVRALNAASPSMKPLGKYRGMDTFSWHNPDLEFLEKTVTSFPFELLWVGNQNEIKGFLDKYRGEANKIQQCIVYGACSDNCSSKIISTPTIHEALKRLESTTFSPGILLFTASDADAEYSMRFFERHISNSHLTS